MRSKKSFCNKEIIRKDIARFWPLWGILFIGLFLFDILPLIFNGMPKAEKYDEKIRQMSLIYNEIQQMYMTANTLVVAGISILAAILVFGYLFKKREAYMLHSFPVTRTVYYCSHYIAGLLMIAVPYTITYLIAGICCMALTGSNFMGIMAGMILQVLIAIIFFYTLSCLVVLLSGSTAISMIIYAVLNVLVSGLFAIVSSGAGFFLNYAVVNHASMAVSEALSKFIYSVTPIVNLEKMMQEWFYKALGIRTGGMAGMLGLYRVGMDSVEQLADITHGKYVWLLWQQVGWMALYLIPAAVFFVISYYLYQKRDLERVGETLAFPWGRAVFNWVFTICGSYLFLQVMYFISRNALMQMMGTYRRLYYAGVVYLVLGCIISYLISNMILQKSFRIWKNISYVQIGVCLVCVLGLFFTVRYDCYHRPLPAAEKITGLKIFVYNGNTADSGMITVTRDEEIRQILQSMNELNDKAEDMEILDEATGPIQLECFCEMGERSKSFTIDCLGNDGNKKQADAIFSVLNNKETMMEKLFPGEGGTLNENVYQFYLEDRYGSEETENDRILNRHKKEVFEALKADVEAGSISFDAKVSETDEPEEDIAPYDVDGEDSQEFYDVLMISENGKKGYYGEISLYIRDCENLKKLLRDLGIEKVKVSIK